MKTFEEFLTKKNELHEAIWGAGHTPEAQVLGKELGELCREAWVLFPDEMTELRRNLAASISNKLKGE